MTVEGSETLAEMVIAPELGVPAVLVPWLPITKLLADIWDSSFCPMPSVPFASSPPTLIDVPAVLLLMVRVPVAVILLTPLLLLVTKLSAVMFTVSADIPRTIPSFATFKLAVPALIFTVPPTPADMPR